MGMPELLDDPLGNLLQEISALKAQLKEISGKCEKKSGEVDQLSKSMNDVIGHKIKLIEHSLSDIKSQLAKMGSDTQQTENMLNEFGGRLTSAEEKIGEMDTQIRSSTVETVESEEAKHRKDADSIASRLKDVQKVHLKLQNGVLVVTNVYLTHLGLYAMLFTFVSLLFQEHVSCEWAEKIGIGLMVGFAIVLGSQIYSYDCEVRIIGLWVKDLIGRLPTLRDEADTLVTKLTTPMEANTHAGAETLTPTRTSGCLSDCLPGLRIVRHLFRIREADENRAQDGLVERAKLLAEILARSNGLEKSLEKFTCNFRQKMIIPAAFIFIVFVGLMFSICEYCD